MFKIQKLLYIQYIKNNYKSAFVNLPNIHLLSFDWTNKLTILTRSSFYLLFPYGS